MPNLSVRILMPAMALAAASLAACTTASIEDAAPVSTAAFPPRPTPPGAAVAAEETAPPVQESALAPTEGPRETGAYPNLNVTPGVANEQISAEKKAANVSDLKARQQNAAARTAGLKSPGDEARLRKLGESHADEALKAIEGSD